MMQGDDGYKPPRNGNGGWQGHPPMVVVVVVVVKGNHWWWWSQTISTRMVVVGRGKQRNSLFDYELNQELIMLVVQL